MRTNLYLGLVAAALMTGCGGGAVTEAQSPTSASASSKEASPTSAAAKDSTRGARELVNPDASTMVFLYYELAHLPLPIDTWVEEDSRVRYAPAPDKAARRYPERTTK